MPTGSRLATPQEPSTPWNGEGISYAYETGRVAAGYVSEAIGSGDVGVLRRYPVRLQDEYGLYYKMARIFVKLIGYPSVMRTLAHVGLRKPTLSWNGHSK